MVSRYGLSPIFSALKISRTTLGRNARPSAAHFPHRAGTFMAEPRQTSPWISPAQLVLLVLTNRGFRGRSWLWPSNLLHPARFFRSSNVPGATARPFTLSINSEPWSANAEQFKHELRGAMNKMTGPVFKVTNDPRVTLFGKFLRKYSLDELPQLLERPARRDEPQSARARCPWTKSKRFNDLAHRRRARGVKPGLTCLWQIKDEIKFPTSRTGFASTSNILTTGRSGSTCENPAAHASRSFCAAQSAEVKSFLIVESSSHLNTM